jgi:hypothetical protein
MATPAQIRANRENAQRSTGPRTEASKQTTRLNALKHGLAATLLVLSDEDATKFDALRAQLIADYEPAGETERMLVEELTQSWFRLQRARAHETRVLDDSIQHDDAYNPLFMNVLRYSTAAQRGFHQAHRELRAVQAERRKLEQSGQAQPQAAEKEKVMAVGSVLYNDFEAPPAPEPAAEPDSELTTDNRQLTTIDHNAPRRPVVDIDTLVQRESNWASAAIQFLRNKEAEGRG